MSTVTKDPSAFVLTTPVALSPTTDGQALAVLPPRGTPSEELRAALAVVARGERALDTITRNKGSAPTTLLHRIHGWTSRHPRLCNNVAMTSGVLATIGGVLGTIVGGLNHESVLLGLVGGAKAAGVLGLPLWALLGLDKAVAIDKKAALERSVSVSDVQPMLTTFDKADGAAKVLIGREISRWHDTMDRQKMLSPEARIALRKATDTNIKAARSDVEAAEVLSTLAHTLKGTALLTTADTTMLEKAIGRAPADIRVALAETAQAIIKENKRPVEYEARHQLFALPERVANPPSRPSNVWPEGQHR